MKKDEIEKAILVEKKKYDYTYTSSQYDEPKNWSKPKYTRIVEGIYKMKPESILDLGCGQNELNKIFVKLIPNFYGTGVDISSPKADLICSGHDMPISDKSHDVCVVLDTLEHIPEIAIRDTLSEIRRTCKRVYFNIALFEEHYNDRGECLHVCVKEPDWWMNTMSDFFTNFDLNLKVGWPGTLIKREQIAKINEEYNVLNISVHGVEAEVFEVDAEVPYSHFFGSAICR